MKACVSCGKQIANNVAACPFCGKAYTTGGTKLVMILMAVVLAVIVLAVMSQH